MSPFDLYLRYRSRKSFRSILSSWSVPLKSMFRQWYLPVFIIFEQLYMFMSWAVHRWSMWIESEIWFIHRSLPWSEFQSFGNEYSGSLAISYCIWLCIFLNVSFYNHLVSMVKASFLVSSFALFSASFFSSPPSNELLFVSIDQGLILLLVVLNMFLISVYYIPDL